MNSSQYYFGCIKKNEFSNFLKKFHNSLNSKIEMAKIKPEKKPFEIEIRSTADDRNGIAIELFTFNKTNCNEFIDIKKNYLNNANIVFSINLETKDEKYIPEIKKYYEEIQKGNLPNIFKLIPIPKEIADCFKNFNFHFRNNGKKFAIDFIPINTQILEPLLLFGIDITEYHTFQFILKTNLNMNELYLEDIDLNNFILDLLSILFYFNSSGQNVRLLTDAFKEGLKEIKLVNERIQKNFDEIIKTLNLLNSFHGSRIKLLYDPKPLAMNLVDNNDKDYLKQLKEIIKAIVSNTIKSLITNSNDFAQIIKFISFDYINLSMSIPKYKNGYTLSFKFPGANNFIDNFK